MSDVFEVDFLVVGSGIAGLTFALNTAQHGTTLILTKKDRAESNTNYAQGGIAGVMSEDDDVQLHADDTLTAGAGLCRPDAVNILVTEGPERIQDLIARGARFNMQTDSDGHRVLDLGREGGHSRNRIVHTADRTGWECERTLLAAAKDAPNLRVLEHFFVLDLAVDETGGTSRCVGVYALDTRTGAIHLFNAGAVLLATGGCGQVYKHTTNPAIATGDGVAMAWRAGASIANMEFIQFHPTSLYHPQGKSFLISEAVRGEGGILRTADGSTFMEYYHTLRELAPRDIVARAIHAERLKRGEPCVFLDVTHLEGAFLRERFPTIYDRCLRLGIDITRQPIPVVPAAHYLCGGVRTDLNGQTTVEGLFAAGEVACTGVHGANRLASNSLLEAMVFGHRAALRAVEIMDLDSTPAPFGMTRDSGVLNAPPNATLDDRTRLQEIMNEHVGIVRSDETLSLAQDLVEEIRANADAMATLYQPTPELFELRNMSQVARLIVHSAFLRKESRGLHFTTDHPETDDAHWKRDTVLQRPDSPGGMPNPGADA